MASSLIVEVVPVHLEPLPNSDFLSIAQVKGWQCIVRTADFDGVDRAVYIPIDAVVPDKECYGFLDKATQEDIAADGCQYVRPKYRRIKTIKLRKMISQGLLLPVTAFKSQANTSKWTIGQDVAQELGITKYEPPVANGSLTGARRGGSPFIVENSPRFHKFTDIENIKNYPDVIEDGTEVVITEKIHGTNFRAGMVGCTLRVGSHNREHIDFLREMKCKNWFDKILVKLKLKKPTIVERKNPYVYWKTIWDIPEENDFTTTLLSLKGAHDAEDVIMFGEVYGTGVQDLTYGENDTSLRLFGISVNGNYLDWDDFVWAANQLKLPVVPVLYRGPYSKEIVDKLTTGKSVLYPQQIREGVVVTPVEETWSPRLGRVILKSISPDYLLRKNATEDH